MQRWRPFPYLSNSTRLLLDAGRGQPERKLALNNAATASKTGESLRFAGKGIRPRAQIFTDQSTQQMFAQWAELSSQDLKLATGAGGTRVELADLLLDQPRGDIVIGERLAESHPDRQDQRARVALNGTFLRSSSGDRACRPTSTSNSLIGPRRCRQRQGEDRPHTGDRR